jgi:hypothetical protein
MWVVLLGCCVYRVRINTLSKARYGTLTKQLGGWGWIQDVLQVGRQAGRQATAAMMTQHRPCLIEARLHAGASAAAAVCTAAGGVTYRSPIARV